ncbi:MAG: hypothetical protein JKY48_06385 [Flavobacteriales bacterium]|nr:hypothetical protein [Flavobacteriales bacterium]
MRKISGLFIVILMGLWSCEKDQALTPNPSFIDNQVASFTADLNGVNFSAGSPVAVFDNGAIVIGGNNSLGANLSLSMPGQNQGIYSLDASGATFIQYQKDVQDPQGLLSSFFSATPIGTIHITEINTAQQTISGIFSGRIDRSPLLTSNQSDSIIVTNGEFNYVPYSHSTVGANDQGFFKLEADAVLINMSTGASHLLDGVVNSDTYQYFNFSSATANFNESIAIELDDSRHVVGMTTYFRKEHSDPLSGISADSLATSFYSVGGLGNLVDYDSQSGSVTITKIETVNGQQRTSGTFNFVGESSSGTQISITNGSFECVKR